MEQILPIVAAGLVAGLVHVYMGADHLAALLPISIGRKAQAAWLGVRWGIGHSLGVLVVAVLLLVTRASIDLLLVGVWGERLVGVMLIAFAVLGFRAAYRNRFHLHEHSHDGSTHAHLHVHDASDAHAQTHSQPAVTHLHRHAAFGAGTLHGVGGMAHVMGVLPSLALPALTGSIAYLGAFAAGSIAAMAIYAAAIGVLTARFGGLSAWLPRAMMVVASSACLLVGVGWIVAPLMGYELP
ncbi:MAG TPA: High-affinity nickel transporter [Chromatiales bacterium]|nr:High-affinity nickel transporter [Chromatiales bacterium]